MKMSREILFFVFGWFDDSPPHWVEIQLTCESRARTREQREKVQREIGILSQISNPQIVRFHAAFESWNEIVIITEILSGGELFDRLYWDTTRDFTLQSGIVQNCGRGVRDHRAGLHPLPQADLSRCGVPSQGRVSSQWEKFSLRNISIGSRCAGGVIHLTSPISHFTVFNSHQIIFPLKAKHFTFGFESKIYLLIPYTLNSLLQPENMVCVGTNSNTIKIIDFGTAKIVKVSSSFNFHDLFSFLARREGEDYEWHTWVCLSGGCQLRTCHSRHGHVVSRGHHLHPPLGLLALHGRHGRRDIQQHCQVSRFLFSRNTVAVSCSEFSLILTSRSLSQYQ